MMKVLLITLAVFVLLILMMPEDRRNSVRADSDSDTSSEESAVDTKENFYGWRYGGWWGRSNYYPYFRSYYSYYPNYWWSPRYYW